MSLLYSVGVITRVCQIGMQGPQLCAKPRHFCKLDVATSRMAILELNLLTWFMYKLTLQIQTIKGALLYKRAPLTHI